jgi:hypothetical protein
MKFVDNIPTPDDQLTFLQKIQRLLDEGSYSSTYKYALLLSLADLSIEKGFDDSSSLVLSSREIAEKFIQLYWKQANPFPSTSGSKKVLLQNTSRQAAIVKNIVAIFSATSSRYSELTGSPRNHGKLITEVSNVVKKMPLWKLQRIGNEVDDFLYEQAEGANKIVLKKGVVFCFRRFYRQIYSMVQDSWVQKIREISKNKPLLGQNTNLKEFLFGTERSDLTIYVPLLRELQNSCCFYCNRSMKSKYDVDHFIPWVRYPVDLGHNFVLACKTCNSSKGCLLAADRHLENWANRNRNNMGTLVDYYNEHNLSHNYHSSIEIVRWSYKQAEDMKSHLWVEKDNLLQATSGWQSILN